MTEEQKLDAIARIVTNVDLHHPWCRIQLDGQCDCPLAPILAIVEEDQK